MEHPSLDLTVIIPTCDMAAHLPALIAALDRAGVPAAVRAVIFVDDGSRDQTPALLAALPPPYRTITLAPNRGRFGARLAGALAAETESVLFLDTRTTPGEGFVAALADAVARGCAMCTVRIDVTKSVFNLYWERTHALIFRRQRARERDGFVITPETYGEFVTGTGGFLCPRAAFLAACESFGGHDPRSDDTHLLEKISVHRPISVRADWFVYWEPRQSLGAFLHRLWERGPGFAEYHLLVRRGLYFYVLVACGLYLALGLALLTRVPGAGTAMLAAIPVGLAATTLTFARSPIEFVRLVPLHLLVCATAAVSIGRGLLVCLRDQRRETA